MNTQDQCRKAIQQYGGLLDCADLGLNPYLLLGAIAYCESSLGIDNKPRFEKAYAPGGHYYRISLPVQDSYKQFGKDAACSYSSFQILYITAYEMGYRGTPRELADDMVAIQYVIRFLNRRIIRGGASDLEDIADAYNSGTFRDDNVPTAYIEKFTRAYYGKEVLDFLKEVAA